MSDLAISLQLDAAPSSPQELLIEVRITGEYVLDTYLFLRGNSENVVATLVQATGAPICEQLSAKHRRTPDLTLQQAAKEVQLSREVRAARNVPLLDLVEQLHEIKVPMEAKARLFFPSRTIEVVSKAGTASVSTRFSVPEPLARSVAYSTDTEPAFPELATWVEHLLDTIGPLDLQAGQ